MTRWYRHIEIGHGDFVVMKLYRDAENQDLCDTYRLDSKNLSTQQFLDCTDGHLFFWGWVVDEG